MLNFYEYNTELIMFNINTNYCLDNVLNEWSNVMSYKQ